MRTLAVLVALAVLLVVPLSGCVGDASGPDETSPAANRSSGPTGNETDNGSSAAGTRPHVHDRWKDPASGESIEEATLVDRAVTIEPYRTSTNPTRPLEFDRCEKRRTGAAGPRPCFGWTEFRPGTWGNGDPKIVPPGTDRLEVTVEFDSGDFDAVDFYYQDRNRSTWQWLTDDAHDGPFRSGDTKTLDVDVRMADDGHARVSSWRFAVKPARDPWPGPVDPIGYGAGDIDVQVVAHRVEGDLPIEPAHPEFWQEDDPPTDHYLVGEVNGSTERFVQAGRVDWEPDSGGPKVGVEGLVWEIPVGFHGRRITDPDPPPALGTERSAGLVPPGSAILAVKLTIADASTTTAGSEVRACVVGQNVPNTGFPQGEERSEKVIGECKPFADGTHLLTEALDENEADSLYTNTSRGVSASRWTIYVQVAAEGSTDEAPAIASWSGSVSAEVYASTDAAFEPRG